MRRITYYGLVGTVALALMIGASSAARAGGDQEQTSTWVLGNIVQGLANALNGTERPGQVATLQSDDRVVRPAAEAGAVEQPAVDAKDPGTGS